VRIRIPRASASAVTAVLTTLHGCRSARAEPPQWHLEVAGVEPLGDPQAHEYGLGTSGRFALEVPVSRAFGPEIQLGGLWLPHTNAPADPSIANHGDGTALLVSVGVRVRPFAEVAGPWADLSAGYVRTGPLGRLGVDMNVGYDWRIGRGRWDLGPYVGYFQVIQPDDTLRPQDGRMLSVGIHVALGASPRPRVVVSYVEPLPAPPPLPPPPPPPPAPDRDNDTVLDVDDACPDVPGVHTDDPKTNGCPPAGDQVHVVEDRIEYDDVIHFDTDQAHVHRASWPILQRLANFINANPDIEQVDITGHADERGAEEYNIRLSQDRAQAVKALLVRFGVEDKRVTTVGYGNTRPRVPGHSEHEWRQNRRVEFIITKVRNVRGGTTSLPQTQGETR